MGYSCTVKASLVVDAVKDLIQAQCNLTSTNAMPDGGFFEIGRENRDGAITGTVWKLFKKLTREEKIARAKEMNVSNPDWVGDSVTKRGYFKVSAEGKIVRWPGLPRKMITEAEKIGAQKFTERYTGMGW